MSRRTRRRLPETIVSLRPEPKRDLVNKNTVRTMGLDDPKKAREFLAGLMIGNRRVTEFTLANGNTRRVSDMDDEEVVMRAAEIASWLSEKN